MGNCVRFWFAIRRTHTVEHISGEDTLGMKPETTDRSFPWFGKVPLPPVMIQQLDMILTLGILQPLKKRVLDEWQRLITCKKPSTWLTMYLITFMSMHGCALTTSENYNSARKHGLRVGCLVIHCRSSELKIINSAATQCQRILRSVIIQQTSCFSITTIVRNNTTPALSSLTGRGGKRPHLQT